MLRQNLPISIVLLIVLLLSSSCDNGYEGAEDRKWLADQADSFIGIYKVAYDQVFSLQGTPHPCTKGHKAEEAALFHAVLSNLHDSFMTFRKAIDGKFGQEVINDGPSRDMLSVVERIAKPFAEENQVNKCGMIDAKAAKTQFYLQSPLEAFEAVKRLRTRLEEE